MRRSLPIEYPVRNLGRRPGRSALTALACALVAGVLVATVAFARGLEQSFLRQGRDDTAILLSTASQGDLVRSAVSGAVAGLVEADVRGVLEVHGSAAVSPEIHMGTRVRLGAEGAGGEARPGFVRGVTRRAFLVHEAVTLLEGRLPASGEVLVGRLVAEKLRVAPASLGVGRTLLFEGGEWRVAGVFAAAGTTVESEIWAPLYELQSAARRDDVSGVFVRVSDPSDLEEVGVFAQRRLDLELMCVAADEYYGDLARYFAPIRTLAWGMALLIAASAVFTGANTLNTTVQDRLPELATLRALGYSGLALSRSLLLESLMVTAAGGLAGLVVARLAVAGTTFRIGMGAFALEVDGVAVLAAAAGVLALGLFGTAPAVARLLRLPVAVALKDE